MHVNSRLLSFAVATLNKCPLSGPCSHAHDQQALMLTVCMHCISLCQQMCQPQMPDSCAQMKLVFAIAGFWLRCYATTLVRTVVVIYCVPAAISVIRIRQ